MAGSFDSYQVLYSNGPPADPVRLGQLLVDESEAAPADMLKYCSSLSPVTYLSFTDLIPASVVGANPTASVGLTAVNGSALTFLRSDGAPPLDQGIVPTWTGAHTWSSTLTINGAATFTVAPILSMATPLLRFVETDGSTDEQRWAIRANAEEFQIGATLDDNTAFRSAFTVARLLGAVTSIEIGNGTNDPDLNLLITELNIQGDPGSAGQVLASQGAGAAPEWIDGTGITVPSLEDEIMADSPIGYWKLDEASGNFADSSGNSRTMTAQGSPTYQHSAIVPRETTKFVYWDATGDHADRTDTCGFSVPITGDWTVTAVVSLGDSGDCTIFAISGSGELEVNNTQINARVVSGTGNPLGTFWEYNAGTDQITTSGFAMVNPIFRPFHLAWVKDGTANNVTFYVNGQILSVNAYTNEPTGGSGAGVVSEIHGNGAGTAQAVSAMAHVAVFASALSQTRVRAQARAAGFLPSV